MSTRAIVAITAAASLLASAALVGGVRLVQHLTGSKFERAPVTIDLPGARARPAAAIIGLHASPVRAGRTAVSARKRATGLVSVVARDGTVVGEAVVPRDPLLKSTPVTVSYESTAASLVQETPALLTSSPLVSAVIRSESNRSPAVARLAAVLRSEAAAHGDYLGHPSRRVVRALNAAAIDVAARVKQDFGNAPARAVASRPASSRTVAYQPLAPARAVPVEYRTPASPPPDPIPLPDSIILPDTTGQTACSTHRVTAALCLETTYPLTLSSPELNATDWSAGWQMLFLSNQLSATGSNLPMPFALLPPVVNAPPTIAGVISSTVETGINYMDTRLVCARIQASVTGSCQQPSFLTELKDELLNQLTLAGRSDAVHIGLTSQLQQQPITAVGFGVEPGPAASRSELAAWSVSTVMSIATEAVMPMVQLILDVSGVRSERIKRSAEKDSAAFQARASVVESKIAAHETALGPAPTAGQRASARVNVQNAEHDVALAETEVATSGAKLPKGAQLDVSALQAKLQAAEQNLTTAMGRSKGGYQTAVNRLKAKLKLAKAQRALKTAQAIEDSYDQYDQKAAALAGELTQLRKQAAALQRAAELAQQRADVATAQGFLDEVFAVALEVAYRHQRDLACVYNAMRANDQTQANACLTPIQKDLVNQSGALLPLLANEAVSYGVGLTVSVALTEVCVPCRVIDLIPTAVGVLQDLWELIRTASIPDRHDFPAIDTNYRQGTPMNQVATLFLGAVPSQVLAGGPTSIAAAAAAAKLTGHSPLFVTSVTTVCPRTVIVPFNYVNGRVVGMLNLSNLADLHVAAGWGNVDTTATLGGAVPFAVVDSQTPLGSGEASFADPPPPGSPVHVVDEGAGVHYRTFDGRISNAIPTGQPLVEEVSPDGGLHLAGNRGVGGLVFAARGQTAGQLVGLAEAEQGGRLVVLTGPGVADITQNVATCQPGWPWDG